MKPEVVFLERVPWQFFATMTFRKVDLPRKVRISMFFKFARQISRQHRIFFPNLLWALRLERGEIGGRLHFHSLIGGLPASAATKGNCFAMMALWADSCGGGFARIRLFAPDLDGVSYVIKGLDGPAHNGADLYESGKFVDQSSELMLAASVHRHRQAGRGLSKKQREPVQH